MAQLLIGTDDITSRTIIGSVSCTVGRTTITEQPAPSTFTCEFSPDIESSAYFGGIELGDIVQWSLDDPASGGLVRVFYGEVTDISVRLDNWSQGAGMRMYSVTAVGMSSALNRQPTDSSGYIKQYSGDRIATILSNADWQGYSYNTTYIDVSPTVYEIAAINNGIVNSLALAQEAANSAMGCLFEDHKNGVMRYESYLARKSNTVITLTNDDIIAGNFTITKTANEVANRASVIYGASATQGTIYNDTPSQTAYGIKEGTKTTTLHNSTDANSMAQILLASHKLPTYDLTTITIDTAAISDSLRQSLLNARVGTRIYVTDLPTELSTFDGFIEGYTWTSSVGHDQITMNLSNYGNSYPYTLWTELNNTDTWNTYKTSTTKWSDII